MKSVRQWGLRGFVLVATAAAVVGCSSKDPDAIATVPAAGTVTYKGKPVATGTVQFVPQKGRPASGAIKDGHFILTTYQEEDGAVPGLHQVGVTSTTSVPSKTGGDSQTVYNVPATFSDFSNSGLVAEVPPGGSITLKIDIP